MNTGETQIGTAANGGESNAANAQPDTESQGTALDIKALIRAKVAAGLDRQQAIEILRREHPEEIADLIAAESQPQRLAPDLEALIREKMAVGLSREDALAVIRSQQEQDLAELNERGATERARRHATDPQS